MLATPSTLAPGPRRGDPSALALALAAIALSALAHLWLAGVTELSPQEAYYWQYARHLDLSYFDHPPLAAWTIRAFVELLGTTERAVRMAAVTWSVLFGVFLFLTGRRLFGDRLALVALAVALLTPLLALGQLVITPDDPLLVGWVAALYFTVRAVQDGRGACLLAAGAATGVATLGKYTGWLLAPQILLVLLLDARGRRLLRTPWPYVGLAIAAAMFVPVVVWNARHEWVSFGFQFTRRGSEMATPSVMRVLRFVGLQCVLVSPLLFLVLVWASAAAARRSDPGLRICAVFALPTLAIFTVVSPFAWVKGNWPAPAYPSALLAAAALLWPHRGALRRVLVGAAALAAVVTLYMHVGILVPWLPFPARDVTTIGWRQLAARVEDRRHELAAPSFVVGCGYKVASELAFYLPDRPETFSGNAFGAPGLAYDYWLDPSALAGREGVVVVDRRDRGDCASADRFCSPMTPLETLTIRRGRSEVTTFELWRCRYLPARQVVREQGR